MKYVTLGLACLLAVALQSAAHADSTGEATGLGELKFGVSPDEVKKLYPSLEVVAAEPPPVEGQATIRLSIYRLADQKLGKLTCNVDLKFLVNRLSFLDFYCRDKENIPAYLEATYGKPSTSGDTGWLWQGSPVIVSYAPASGVFSVNQRRANDALQGNMFLYGLMQEGPQPQGQGQQAPAQQ